MDAEQIRQRLDERARCEAAHINDRVPHNGLGWVGSRCPKCGFMFFGEWEEWAAPPSPDDGTQPARAPVVA